MFVFGRSSLVVRLWSFVFGRWSFGCYGSRFMDVRGAPTFGWWIK